MPKSVNFTQALRTWMDVAMPRSMRGWAHHAKASGLSMPQFSILMQLYHRGHCGISDLSERFEISPAAASQHVDNLVQAGLIERGESGEDRRVRNVQLSARGRSLLEKGLPERYRWMEKLQEELAPEDLANISDALLKLAEAARKLE